MMGFNKPYAIDYIFWFLARFNQLVLKYLIFRYMNTQINRIFSYHLQLKDYPLVKY